MIISDRRSWRNWTDTALISAHRKWGRHEAETFRDATELIVQRAVVEPGMDVLDLASGTGEPALALARRVGPSGTVTATGLDDALRQAAFVVLKRQIGAVRCRLVL